MKLKVAAVLLSVILSSYAGCAGLRANKPEPPMSGATKAAVAPLLGFDADAVVVPYRGSPTSLADGPELRWMVVDSNHVLALDKKTERLQVYGFLNRRHESVAGDKPLTKDKAVALAKALLDAGKIKRGFEEFSATLTDLPDKSGAWDITFHNEKKSGSSVYVRIAAWSEKVLFFQVEPPQKITPEDAARLVIAPGPHGAPADCELAGPPRLIIGSPLDPRTKEERAQRRLYWLVVLSYKGETPFPLPPPLFYVDCFTGEVSRI